jgi:hypothetical protein
MNELVLYNLILEILIKKIKIMYEIENLLHTIFKLNWAFI